ncbi:hypothetical protein GCM10012275_24080 [Longimycelium tulufanense]|uniref:Acyl-CoA dehydrogenase/oxidase C-terminal domain-containing protein n=1 Tax=Longimycelium tulufanense TaxID=907463 RepID=A0A8J3FUQ9_9PSEU|nr:acyl-CoA dehydrogenase family protein [Longimycelium tulufanense]GGM52299.1 hypothetical protein GCM10012275_24080 [Longimycelium tulufanense]
MSAKNDDNGRKYGYFILKQSEGFRAVETYHPFGMKVLDYGLNEIDAFVPKHRRIETENRNLGAMVEMLMPPRAMMAALGFGFLRRINREAHAYANTRQIGPAPLASIRFVRYRLKAIETSCTICEALDHHLRTRLNVKADMREFFPAVQALKTVATERMLGSAHHYQQLVGGEGYRCGSPTNIAAQAFLDTRVFTIFDGTNDLLSQQLSEYCLARRAGRSLSSFLASYPLTAPAITAYHLDLSFLDQELEQEHLVLGGRAIAYVIAISQVMRWAKEVQGDAPARARAAIEFLKVDINGIAGEFGLLAKGVLVEGETAGSVSGVLSRSIPVPTNPSPDEVITTGGQAPVAR